MNQADLNPLNDAQADTSTSNHIDGAEFYAKPEADTDRAPEPESLIDASMGLEQVPPDSTGPATYYRETVVPQSIEVARVNLKSFLTDMNGKFVGLDYLKISGTARSLNGRLGVFRHSKGGPNNVERLDRSYLTIWDAKAEDGVGGYRTIDLATVSRVRALGNVYDVVD